MVASAAFVVSDEGVRKYALQDARDAIDQAELLNPTSACRRFRVAVSLARLHLVAGGRQGRASASLARESARIPIENRSYTWIEWATEPTDVRAQFNAIAWSRRAMIIKGLTWDFAN